MVCYFLLNKLYPTHLLYLLEKKRIYIFNKIDQMKKQNINLIRETYNDFYPQFISVRESKGIDTILDVVEDSLKGEIPRILKKRKLIHVD